MDKESITMEPITAETGESEMNKAEVMVTKSSKGGEK